MRPARQHKKAVGASDDIVASLAYYFTHLLFPNSFPRKPDENDIVWTVDGLIWRPGPVVRRNIFEFGNQGLWGGSQL